MNALLLFSVFFFSFPAFARTEARFLGFVGMISITDRVMGRVTDADPQRLYDFLRVEPRNEGGRVGKSIQLEDKKMTLLCADQAAGVKVCTLVVKAGPQGTLQPGAGLIRFVALGEEAARLREVFAVDAGTGRAEYFSEDRSLRITAETDSFVMEYRRR